MFGYKNTIVQADLDELLGSAVQWNLLEGNSFLITGANGMIATYTTYLLMHLVLKRGMNIQVVALSRNRKRSKELFEDFLEDPHFTLLSQDVCELVRYSGGLDYILHFAGNASPYYIKNDPVGIMRSNLLGTMNVLELAKDKSCKKVIFASTREVYGENTVEDSLTETSFGRLDCLDARSCYPESKRAAEALCMSYFLQHGMDFNVVRIAHTYGPGMKLENDGRVMADLLNDVLHERNIVLKSTGEALRAFCYVTDTINGLFRILLDGQSAGAYNLANETEEISIRDLAGLLVKSSSKKNLKVEYHIFTETQKEYCNYQRVRLVTSKLHAIGWSPCVGIEEGVRRIIKSFRI